MLVPSCAPHHVLNVGLTPRDRDSGGSGYECWHALPIESETSRRKFSLYKKESLYLFEMSKFIKPYIPHSESSIPYSGVWVARFVLSMFGTVPRVSPLPVII